MKNKKLKILFFINTPTSYQIDFFIELEKLCNLKIIFYSKYYKNYNFVLKNQKNFFFLEKKSNAISTIKKIINNFNPDFTVIGGYRLKYIDQIIQLIIKNNKKYVFWLERLNAENSLKFRLVNYLIKKKVKKSHGILCVGNDAKINYQKFNKSVINLPYSINMDKFKRKKFFFINNKINFLYVGQLIKRKGINHILNAFNHLSDENKKKISLTIVGDGPYKKKIINLSKYEKYISYKPFLNQKKLIPIFFKNDVFIFPSIFDGWGVAPTEAMASKMSLIVTKNVGMSEILNKKKTKIINYSNAQLLKAIEKTINIQSNIVKEGNFNSKLIKSSLCNVKHSTKYFIKFLKKL
jgi:glycosyltransferase involved in cell wall biosynthesis